MTHPLYASVFNDTTYLGVSPDGIVQNTRKLTSSPKRFKNFSYDLNHVLKALKIEEAVNNVFSPENEFRQLQRMRHNLIWLNTKAAKHNNHFLVSFMKKSKCETEPIQVGLKQVEQRLQPYHLNQLIEELTRRLQDSNYKPEEQALFRGSGSYSRIQYLQEHLHEIDFTKEDIHTLASLLKNLIREMSPSRKENFSALKNQTYPDLLRRHIALLNPEDIAFLSKQIRLLRLVLEKDWAHRVHSLENPLDSLMIVLTDLVGNLTTHESGLLGPETLRVLITDKTIILD